ncbi:ABC transporter permease [candidate division KSB1 bacterium]
MRNIWAVFAREFRSYFVSPIAYVVTSIFLIVTGYFFYTYLTSFLQTALLSTLEAQQMRTLPPHLNINMLVIQPLFHNYSVVSLFMAPMITMRLLAEEKKTMTVELLMTSPVSTTQIILGKFIAGMALFVVMIVPTTAHFIVLIVFGEPEIIPILSGYLGLLLLGAGFIALGLLISSATENQIIAGTVSFGILLLFWVIGWIANLIDPVKGKLLAYISLINHFDDFTKGVIDTQHIVFYLSFMIFGLYLTYCSLESIRWRA